MINVMYKVIVEDAWIRQEAFLMLVEILCL